MNIEKNADIFTQLIEDIDNLRYENFGTVGDMELERRGLEFRIKRAGLDEEEIKYLHERMQKSNKFRRNVIDPHGVIIKILGRFMVDYEQGKREKATWFLYDCPIEDTLATLEMCRNFIKENENIAKTIAIGCFNYNENETSRQLLFRRIDECLKLGVMTQEQYSYCYNILKGGK